MVQMPTCGGGGLGPASLCLSLCSPPALAVPRGAVHPPGKGGERAELGPSLEQRKSGGVLLSGCSLGPGGSGASWPPIRCGAHQSLAAGGPRSPLQEWGSASSLDQGCPPPAICLWASGPPHCPLLVCGRTALPSNRVGAHSGSLHGEGNYGCLVFPTAMGLIGVPASCCPPPHGASGPSECSL